MLEVSPGDLVFSFCDTRIKAIGVEDLVLVPEIRDKLLDAWGIDAGTRVGEFTPDQSAYLDYHRSNVFRKELLGH